MTYALNRKVSLLASAILQDSFRRLFYQPGQDKFQIASDTKKAAGVFAGSVAMYLLKIREHHLVNTVCDRRNMKKFRKKIIVVETHCDGKADTNELEFVSQCVALQHTSVRDVCDLIFVYPQFFSVNSKNSFPFENVAEHTIRNVALRIDPPFVEHVAVNIKKVEAHC